MDGYIFSIEEFSTFDGPGIRTTIFFKGCPLRCQWCHNPEGQTFHPQLLRSPNGCLGCGACTEVGYRKTGKPHLVEESIAVCPKQLIRICGERIDPQNLVNRLQPKLWMLQAAGGGVTFSGGEPLSQPDFLCRCLQLLENKTHRAIQTCGFAPTDVFSTVLDNCDYVLFDLKQMDNEIHKHFTGVDNAQILANYQRLAESGKPFITRIPLIPGVNDSRTNLEATATFMQSLGVDKIELLPYNTGAGAKHKSLGREYKIEFNCELIPQTHADIFHSHNIEVHVL